MIEQPDIRPISEGGYRLEQDYIYSDRSGVTTLDIVTFVVKKGFEYDGASVPRALWSVTGISPDGLNRAAALIHDYIYVAKGNVLIYAGAIKCALHITRAQADRLFLDMLKKSGVGWRSRHTQYLAVRLFGWVYWKE
ncbi:MAG: DUF1353 domain-containing protein [Cryomorphaceae bacterium]|nr:DUF1353 domain-containing protein [Cryomorphaceae bacterium]